MQGRKAGWHKTTGIACGSSRKTPLPRSTARRSTERAGFEPAVQVYPARRFSKPLPSATRSPLQSGFTRPVTGASSRRAWSLIPLRCVGHHQGTTLPNSPGPVPNRVTGKQVSQFSGIHHPESNRAILSKSDRPASGQATFSPPRRMTSWPHPRNARSRTRRRSSHPAW